MYVFKNEKMMRRVHFWLDLRHGRFRTLAPLICGRKPRSLPSRSILPNHQGHTVLLLMLIGAGLSFCLGAPTVALASVTAFLVSETVDWLVYSTTHPPFAERVWWSVLCSAPVDTAVFLAMAGLWSWRLSTIGVASKVLAGGLISLGLRARREVTGAAVAHEPQTPDRQSLV